MFIINSNYIERIIYIFIVCTKIVKLNTVVCRTSNFNTRMIIILPLIILRFQRNHELIRSLFFSA
jgi:hypothetical protein